MKAIGRNALLKQRHNNFLTKFYTIRSCSLDVSDFGSKGEVIKNLKTVSLSEEKLFPFSFAI